MTVLAVGSFDDGAAFQGAVRAARDGERRIVGLWSPMPIAIPGTEERGQRGSVAAMAVAGLAAATLLYLLIWWSAVHAYPFDSGGRPLHSWPAFLVAPVEFGALVAGIAGVGAFLVRARLTRLHDAAFEIEEVSAAARDRFVIAIRCDAGADAGEVIALLGGAGAVHSRVITA